ncbi:UNVERIFIED_CONTAM: WAT1-related protein [Sesamum calycinum]|uniref:WAT1-related protein n=1 Tax=Sesamum calycinum TaxID=2727403 RepID=A0AAW2RA50_9LAMI
MGWKDHIPSESLVMIGCQFTYAAMILVTKKGLSQGMSSLAFVVYRQFVAFLLLAPLAFFTRRLGTNACSMGWKNFWLICLLALVGVTLNMNLYFGGLNLASSTATSALGNLLPAITFVMAYTIGLEKLHLPSARSVAKIIGTVGLGAAVTFLGQSWCVERRGPLFSAMFQPLCTVIVTLFACIFQHEELYTGSFIGSLAVIMGLYIVLWGKAKDHEDVNGETGHDPTSYAEVSDNESCTVDLKEPLLPGK